MTDTELIELARAYIALSNSHRIHVILPMFATGARYTSAALGEFRGQAAIGDMMHGFFTDYPDVYWQASNYRCDDHRVSFDYQMTATNARNGTALERHGVEHIDFTADGSIKSLVVEVS